jgi:DNA modification methylase
MAVIEQKITDKYAVYNSDCIETMATLKGESVHISIFSPPFSELYNYSSSDRDLSNCKNFDEFMVHFKFVVQEITRLTIPGRMCCVHCMEVRKTGNCWRDFPGDIIRLYELLGWHYHGKAIVWKEPLRVAIKTRALGLAHKQIVKDSTKCYMAVPDYVLFFRKAGSNPLPVMHPLGMTRYAGSNPPDAELFEKYRNWKNPKTNKLAHYIWQKYASCVWMDIRSGRLLKYKVAKENPEEKHCCPLQLDVIERCLTLYSNPGEVMLTPFMGVGSEVCGAVVNGRKAIGIELKPSYYRQALLNIEEKIQNGWGQDEETETLLEGLGDNGENPVEA